MLHTDQENNTSDTGKRAPFLRLPLEIRDMIYHLHLTSEKIVPRYTALTKRWAPIDLLYVSRTIYHEAFFHLYTKGDFVLAVRPESIFGLATCYGPNDINPTVSFEVFVRSQKILDIIRHISLEIHWPSVKYSQSMDRGFRWNVPTTDASLKQTITTVGAMLVGLPRLRTIDISWIRMIMDAYEVTESAPSKYKIPLWLRGLKQVRYANKEVLIRMPLEGPISTEELARDQEDRGKLLNLLREIREDVQEAQGCFREDLY